MAAAPTSDAALVLRRYRYGESSLVVHLLTREHGRVHLLAKGAYRMHSGFCGVLDFFDTLRVTWRPGRGDLAPLRAGSIEVRRAAISRDLGRYRAALSVLELVDLVSPGPAEPRAFDLACATLDELVAPATGASPSEPGAASRPHDPAWCLPAFDLRLLGTLGLAPALETCASCGRAAPAVDPEGLRAAFSASSGGRLCLSCARDARAAGRRVGTLPVAVLELARELLRVPAGPPTGLPGAAARHPLEGVAEDTARGLREFVRRFLEYHLETRPRSRQAPGPADRVPLPRVRS